MAAVSTPGPLQARLVLSSRFEHIEVAERALLDLCAQVGCPREDEYWLVTALREAVANAVRHGNRQDPTRTIKVDLGFDDRACVIRVEDEGEGFDYEHLPDPTAPENLLRPSGRGIFYMKQFMSSVEFSRIPGGGTAVVMTRRLEPDQKETA